MPDRDVMSKDNHGNGYKYLQSYLDCKASFLSLTKPSTNLDGMQLHGFVQRESQHSFVERESKHFEDLSSSSVQPLVLPGHVFPMQQPEQFGGVAMRPFFVQMGGFQMSQQS